MFYFMALRSGSLYGEIKDTELGRSVPHPGSSVAPSGMCIFRTANVSDPTSWYAWDGSGYSAKMVNPYTLNKTGGDPLQHVCHVVPQRIVSLRFSLYFSTFYQQFMVVGDCFCDMAGNSGAVSPHCISEGDRTGPFTQEAFCFALSEDLVTWSDLYYIMNVTSIQTWEVHHDDNTTGQWYPAFVDPSVDGYNLDQIGESAYLFFVYFHPKVKLNGKSRDLWRAPVKFSK